MVCGGGSDNIGLDKKRGGFPVGLLPLGVMTIKKRLLAHFSIQAEGLQHGEGILQWLQGLVLLTSRARWSKTFTFFFHPL